MIMVNLALLIEATNGDSRFASVGESSLPREATPGLPIMHKKQLTYY